MKIQKQSHNLVLVLGILSSLALPNWALAIPSILNGQTVTNTLPLGADGGVLYVFNSNLGQPIVIRVGKITDINNNFSPRLKLPGYTTNSGGNAAEISVIGTNPPTFIQYEVYIDNLNGTNGGGKFRLSFATTGLGVNVSPGDEGGNMTNNFAHQGTINVGELDVWTFNATPSNSISLQLTKITGGSSFVPSMRLYAPDGSLLNTVTDTTNAQYSFTAPLVGSYIVVVGDASPGLAGSGTYQLTETGIPTGLNFFNPVIQGTNIILRATGGAGVVASNYVLFAGTNISQPISSWKPILTNQFDLYGTFSVTNAWSKTNPPQFFRFRTP